MKNSRYTRHCQKQKERRKAGNLIGWIGTYITFSPTTDDNRYYHETIHGMKTGDKYLLITIRGASQKMAQIAIPGRDPVFISLELFKEFQKPATT